MTLIDFLLARYSADEEQYRKWALGGEIGQGFRDRLLADLEAKRRIVEVCDDYEEPAPTVLRALSLPYAAHPDYREEWRP